MYQSARECATFTKRLDPVMVRLPFSIGVIQHRLVCRGSTIRHAVMSQRCFFSAEEASPFMKSIIGRHWCQVCSASLFATLSCWVSIHQPKNLIWLETCLVNNAYVCPQNLFSLKEHSLLEAFSISPAIYCMSSDYQHTHTDTLRFKSTHLGKSCSGSGVKISWAPIVVGFFPARAMNCRGLHHG